MEKVIIFAKPVMGAEGAVGDVDRTGITKITLGDIEAAKAEGKRWKLIGRVMRDGTSVRASVRPEKLPISDPLAGVMGATNAATFRTDLMGNVTIVGAGAGKIETGYSVLADLLLIHRFAAGKRAGAAAKKMDAAKKSVKRAAAKAKAKKAPRKAARKAAKKAPKKAAGKAPKRAKKTAKRMKKTARRRSRRA
jgi:hypothetical protein